MNNPINNIDVNGLYSRGYSSEQLRYMFSYTARQGMNANELHDYNMGQGGGGGGGLFPSMY
jgi:hypothetical protein